MSHSERWVHDYNPYMALLEITDQYCRRESMPFSAQMMVWQETMMLWDMVEDYGE